MHHAAQPEAAPAKAHAPFLEADGLVKSYGGKRVVDGLSLRCHPGSVLGLLGPNGAGKTTTIRMLYGFIDPEAGTIRYDGRDFSAQRTELKRLIGVCTQEDTIDQDFTVAQNLAVYATYFRPRVADVRRRVEEILDLFGLTEHADHTPFQLSGGFKRRLHIARSVVHGPRILFLDEPTTGLDPRARIDLWELVDRMRAEGMAIILTTHYMDEAEKLSDQLLVMSRGRAVAEGKPRTVIGDLLGEHVLVVDASEARREEVEAWAKQELGDRMAVVLGQVRAPVRAEQLARFSERFADTHFTVRPPNLEDLFLQLSIEHDEQEQA